MRFILLLFISTLSFSASAQWWRLDLKFKKHERFQLIDSVTDNSILRLPVPPALDQPNIKQQFVDRSEYSFQTEEDIVMKAAKHNMRFRIYADASYNFSDLAHLYIQQNRLSEAKWFLLQSNAISRQQNDDKHTVANLIDLATVKAYASDYLQAQQDLNEAHDIASIKGMQDMIAEIEQMQQYLKQSKPSSTRPVFRYAADAQQSDTKAE